MTSLIKVNDTVIVTQARPCGCLQGIGEIFRVDSLYIYAPDRTQYCLTCKKPCPSTQYLMARGGRAARMAFRLTKVLPLVELEPGIQS